MPILTVGVGLVFLYGLLWRKTLRGRVCVKLSILTQFTVTAAITIKTRDIKKKTITPAFYLAIDNSRFYYNLTSCASSQDTIFCRGSILIWLSTRMFMSKRSTCRLNSACYCETMTNSWNCVCPKLATTCF